MEKKILDRINKLLALSKNPNVNEGNSAMEMAEKLMAENGISFSDLDASRLENDLGPINESDKKYRCHQFYPWEKSLSYIIAQHFGCISYTRTSYDGFYRGKPKKVYAIVFVGHESNRITAEIMYNWIRKLIAKQAKESVHSSEISSFCWGAVMALKAKYEVKKSEIVSNCPAVVDEVQKYVEENLNLKTKKSRAVSIYSGASEAGKKAGENISLNRQFGLKQISA